MNNKTAKENNLSSRRENTPAGTPGQIAEEATASLP